ncbi:MULTISPECIES: hypothetical protein [Rhizobium]|uniref:Uncharacterized protein n=2 Tax=Rhizobium TaxID=379 RepID=A0ABY8IQF2_9HYPH|nr:MULTISPECIES: hypothetical protein [Rhizobium]MBO9170651.1 hypothetical protein [Rhizobium sp. L245/93]MBO9187663.1 hypothetical protein [Rhizobium sp. E27B/91]QXZ80339.1 hypothetical protein J5274_21095 [Rhizobium sp. L51/94]QYA04759.1 hypothetical protein J5278_21825 [Rhizobium sp. B21/90]WFS25680.1 hypothetical protein PR018_19070 [Rhizobium rhododendri]
MSGPASKNNRRPILVFLPANAANTIVAKLELAGYPAVAVTTVPDLFDALRTDAFALAVTVRPQIDIVRNIITIPVVNLEVFFHMSLTADSGEISSKQFDVNAFVNRIKTLTAPRSGREPEKVTEFGRKPTGANPAYAGWRKAAAHFFKSRSMARMDV